LGEAKQSNFIIFRLSSFENAFAGMLAWEETLAEDIGPLFKNSTKLATLYPTKEFEDITARNKDARVLRSETGEILLLYSFFDNNTLIITENDEAMRSLINKLSSSLLSR
jgi:hypothetical protein